MNGKIAAPHDKCFGQLRVIKWKPRQLNQSHVSSTACGHFPSKVKELGEQSSYIFSGSVTITDWDKILTFYFEESAIRDKKQYLPDSGIDLKYEKEKKKLTISQTYCSYINK